MSLSPTVPRGDFWARLATADEVKERASLAARYTRNFRARLVRKIDELNERIRSLERQIAPPDEEEAGEAMLRLWHVEMTDDPGRTSRGTFNVTDTGRREVLPDLGGSGDYFGGVGTFPPRDGRGPTLSWNVNGQVDSDGNRAMGGIVRRYIGDGQGGWLGIRLSTAGIPLSRGLPRHGCGAPGELRGRRYLGGQRMLLDNLAGAHVIKGVQFVGIDGVQGSWLRRRVRGSVEQGLEAELFRPLHGGHDAF